MGDAEEHAARSAVVAHAHPAAVAGAVAVAVAAALSWQLREQPTGRAELLERVVEQVPPSAVRDGLTVARNLPAETSAEAAAQQLGSGSDVSCQDTVPFAIWCAAGPHTSFEEAIGPCAGSSASKRLPEPQGQGSLRPSFSLSSLSPWTSRSPRLTCVSDGKPLRRLLVTSKAVQVVELVVAVHGGTSSGSRAAVSAVRRA